MTVMFTDGSTMEVDKLHIVSSDIVELDGVKVKKSLISWAWDFSNGTKGW